MENFLPHLFEPARLNIGVTYVKGEMRKFMPSVRDEAVWENIDADIETWPEKLSMPNFWNGVHGISMGFRLKSLVPWITSLHIQWEEKDVPVTELWFGAPPSSAPEMHGAVCALDVRENLYKPENERLLYEWRERSDTLRKITAPRDHFPIFAVIKKERITVVDGNGRLLNAILTEKETVRAHIGTPRKEPVLYEHWLPTQILTELAFWHKREKEAGNDATEIFAKSITKLIKNSSAARKEFETCVIHKNDGIHEELLRAVNAQRT